MEKNKSFRASDDVNQTQNREITIPSLKIRAFELLGFSVEKKILILKRENDVCEGGN